MNFDKFGRSSHNQHRKHVLEEESILTYDESTFDVQARRIINAGDPEDESDVVNKQYLYLVLNERKKALDEQIEKMKTECSLKPTFWGLDAGNQPICNLGEAKHDSDAVTYKLFKTKADHDAKNDISILHTIIQDFTYGNASLGEATETAKPRRETEFITWRDFSNLIKQWRTQVRSSS